MLAVAGMVAASVSITQAQPYYVSGAALTPAWTPGTAANLMAGSPLSLTTATVAGVYNPFKVTGASWSDPNYPGSDALLKGDANGTNTFYFYPGSTVDGWLPVNNRVGYEDPGTAWEIAGDLNSWSGGPGYQLYSLGNGLFSNTIVIPTAGSWNVKFRISGSGAAYIGTDFGKDASTIPLTTTSANQLVKFQLDLPHGRYVVGDLVAPPVTNQVVFAVDMSSQIQLGLFVPGTDAVFVSGGFNGWPGTGVGALVLTNVPFYNNGLNANIYYATNTFVGSPSSLGSEYKFTDNHAGIGYEPRSANRSFNLLSTNGLIMLPVVSFGDVTTSDYLNGPIDLTFRVNMNGATNTFGVAWAGQGVYINGNFLNGGWSATWNNLSLPQMTEELPTGSGIYTFTYTVPAGNPVNVKYKYSFNDGVNSFDNEAPSFQDHGRTIRTTVTGSYTNALDTFGNQYVEPTFGQLAVGAPAGGAVGLTWLGRPGVYVQTCTNLTSGSWVNHTNTDGIYWDTGSYSTNGLVSATNWPAGGGSQFFRLIKP